MVGYREVHVDHVAEMLETGVVLGDRGARTVCRRTRAGQRSVATVPRGGRRARVGWSYDA